MFHKLLYISVLDIIMAISLCAEQIGIELTVGNGNGNGNYGSAKLVYLDCFRELISITFLLRGVRYKGEIWEAVTEISCN